MTEINVHLSSEEKKSKGDMTAALEYLKCLLWSSDDAHSVYHPLPPRVKLGQMERFYANICENHQKFELKQVLQCLSPLRLLACWAATHTWFHFMLLLVTNWGNHLKYGAMTRLCILCDINHVKQTAIPRKEARRKYTKSFSTQDIWRVALVMLCFLPPTW